MFVGLQVALKCVRYLRGSALIELNVKAAETAVLCLRDEFFGRLRKLRWNTSNQVDGPAKNLGSLVCSKVLKRPYRLVSVSTSRVDEVLKVATISYLGVVPEDQGGQTLSGCAVFERL